MRICYIGLNHRTTPVELRELISVAATEVGEQLQSMMQNPAIREAALLSTCNRVEFTVVTHDPDAAIACVHQWFANRAQGSLESIVKHLYTHTTDAAVAHLFAVASGLDSLVLGEPQILGQVKSAYDQALEHGTAGHILHRLFQSTFTAAKRARSETAIGRQSVNISSCAVELAKHIFGELHDKTVMLIGAGEMAELAAVHLRAQGVKRILVANRTLERAKILAEKFSAHALSLEQLDDYLDAADILISSTGASTYVLLAKQVKAAMKKRGGRPCFMVDIAVPRDLDPRIADLDGVYLYDIDDLQQVVQGNQQNREQEAEQARLLIQEDVAHFLHWLKSLETVPLIRHIQQKHETLRQEEWQKAQRHLKSLNDEQRQAVEYFSKALSKRLMHSSLKTLKNLPEDIEGDLLMGAARLLFDLDNKLPQRSGHKHDQSSTG